MWWREPRVEWRRLVRLGSVAAVFAAASLTAGCWGPLYATHNNSGISESVYDKLNAVEIPPINAPKGTPIERVAVGVRNELQFALNGGAGANAPTYKLVVNVGPSQFTVVVDPISGRPDAQVASVAAFYQLVELATGKTVVNDNTFAHVDFDIPGPQQRFAKQRAQRDAEDRAMKIVAETIRNRLASYFVAGT